MRIRSGRWAGGLAATAVMLCLGTASADAAGWTSISGGPGGNPFAEVFPGTDSTERWTSTMHSATAGYCVSADAQRVYAIREDQLDPSFSRLVALNRADGSLAWQSPRYPFAGELECPALGGGRVVVEHGPTLAPPANSAIVAYDATTGTPAWTTESVGGGGASSPLTINAGTQLDLGNNAFVQDYFAGSPITADGAEMLGATKWMIGRECLRGRGGPGIV